MKGDQTIDRLMPHAIERGFVDVRSMLVHLYVEEKLSVLTISNRLDVSTQAIFDLLRRFGIPRRFPGSGQREWKRSMGRFFNR